jgi:hypothetical protein
MKKLFIICNSIFLFHYLPAQSNLSKQLQQLLDYSKDGFNPIKGEEIKTYSADLGTSSYFDQKYYSRFRTVFLPEDAAKSEIRYYPDNKSTKFIASFDYMLIPGFYFSSLFDKMKKELGNSFSYEADEKSIRQDGYYEKSQKVVFYRKNTKLPRIELIFNRHDDTITNGMPPGILIVVEALKNLSAISDRKSSANQTNLAKQLLELLDYAKDGFKAIKGEPNEAMKEKNKYSGAKYFKTSVALKEAVENYIEETNSKIKFKADFGKNLTINGGKELFKELSKKIKEGAWNDFEIKEYSGYIFGDFLKIRRKNDYTHTILLTFDDGEYNETTPKVYITVE